jgi:transcriptional regulator GlxA family with amidase domain
MKIGLLVYPGCMPAGLFACADHFRAISRRLGRPAFETCWISVGGEPVDMAGGPAPAYAETPCDAYLLPGFWAESAADIDAMLARQSQLVDWLRRLPRETPLWSYCMGVALLAAAGRLDRRAATATWWLEQPLRARFGAVAWAFRQAVAEDGEVMTAGGANGYWALLGKLLAARVPPEVIRDVELAMLIPSPNAAHPVFRPVELFAQPAPQLQRLIAYAQKVPASELGLDAAAAYLAVSSRTLSRKIDKAAQMGAGEWLRLVKLHQVADMLVASTAPVKSIVAALGFADDASLMRAFRKATGLTTSQYRQQYGHALAARRVAKRL